MFVSLLLALGMQAEAAEPKFTGTQKGEAAEKAETKLTANFGGALTTGNSEFYTLTAGLNGHHRWQRSKLTLVAAGVAGSARVDTDGNTYLDEFERAVPMKENARRVAADLRYDFFLTENNSLYALVGGFHDIFAGLNYRLKEEVGYSRLIVNKPNTKLVGELGLAFVQENYTLESGQDNVQFLAARGMLGLTHKFSEGVGFEDTLVVYENLFTPVDLRIENTAALTSALSSKFSIKLGHTLGFDNQPATVVVDNEVRSLRKLDQTMTVTLVASLL